jgi:predicted O-methyltransferase YrrM
MNPLHPVDKRTFGEHPAPLWEAWMKLHLGHINHTLPHYGPMFYSLIRALTCETVVEIGVAEGYTCFFMANAVRDNCTRYGFNGRYIGIDININEHYLKPFRDSDLPIEFWEMDSLDVKPEMFEKPIDLIFQDGCHETEHCLKELELFYPLLKDKGDGYIIMHDVHYLCEEYFNIIRKDPRYNFEYVRFVNNYGLAICRKMDGYDQNKRICPEAWSDFGK